MIGLSTYYRGRVTFKELYSELDFRVVKVFQRNMFNELKEKQEQDAKGKSNNTNIDPKAMELLEDELLDSNIT